MGQPRRQVDARLDAPGLGPDAVEVLERELVQVLVGQAPLGQRVHVGARLADEAGELAHLTKYSSQFGTKLIPEGDEVRVALKG